MIKELCTQCRKKKSLGNEYFIVLNKFIVSNENKHG